MDLDAFSAKLRDLFAGDPRAGRPVDRRFRAVVDDVPGMATVWPTPGVSRAIFSTASVTSTVRSSEAESGSWILTSR